MPHRVPKTRQLPGRIASLMLAAGLLAGAAHVQAQSGGLHLMPSWYLTPQISAFDPDDGFRVNRHGWGGGLRIGKPVSNDWDVQLLVSHARATDSGNKLNQTLLGGEALFLISRGEFQPFLSLGLGAERDSRSLAGVNTSRTSPYASVGAGAGAATGSSPRLSVNFGCGRWGIGWGGGAGCSPSWRTAWT